MVHANQRPESRVAANGEDEVQHILGGQWAIPDQIAYSSEQGQWQQTPTEKSLRGMARMRALRVSIFLTESHEFDGPLMVIPGSHETSIRCAGETPENRYEQSLRKQKYGGPTQAALQQLLVGRKIVAPKVHSRAVVFIDCNLMHGSSGNLSPDPRVNLFTVYNSVDHGLQTSFCDRPSRPEYLAERTVGAVTCSPKLRAESAASA